MTSIQQMMRAIRERAALSQRQLAQLLGSSLVTVNAWERGARGPSPAQARRIQELYGNLAGAPRSLHAAPSNTAFASRGLRRRRLPLFDPKPPTVKLSPDPLEPLLERIVHGRYYGPESDNAMTAVLQAHRRASKTATAPTIAGMSAGKNTYTYDAHTYHTKVPPQGIAELIAHYLPDGGLVLDPFAGSGMTGVATRVLGYDCILNELSPAACFIASQFTNSFDPDLFAAGALAVIEATAELRHHLYITRCRECGRLTELLFTVWAYNVICSDCSGEFNIWDRCRKLGRTVREHKLLSQFTCPHCGKLLRKSLLQRASPIPVLVGYKCCTAMQREHPPTEDDLEAIGRLQETAPLADGFYPSNALPRGVNLAQPAKHGIERVDKFYTRRNLSAMSHLWQGIHRVESGDLAAQLAFVFTSLYQRVTQLSEYRFWGGSGNTARFNVPFIFNEANVFVTFERKARTIQDHLETTASKFSGRAIVANGSAISLDYLPDESVDLIFTDPPFGSNINYSEMNFLWEAWLGAFTDPTTEVIINRVQGKDVSDYERLMTLCLRECHRVLRPGHWLLLMFMNSSSQVWSALKQAITGAGFAIEHIDVFDKQHGTFKQFVSENTTGCDLVLHCRKLEGVRERSHTEQKPELVESIHSILSEKSIPTHAFIHVERLQEVDFRKLYSDWLARSLPQASELIDFLEFRKIVKGWLASTHHSRSAP